MYIEGLRFLVCFQVAYAVRMALWQYQFGSNLTLPCDSVVKSSCDTKEAKAIENVVIGTYGQCLTLSQNFKGMNPECKALVRVATKEGFYVGDNPEADLAAEIAKLKEVHCSFLLNVRSFCISPEDSLCSTSCLSRRAFGVHRT